MNKTWDSQQPKHSAPTREKQSKLAIIATPRCRQRKKRMDGSGAALIARTHNVMKAKTNRKQQAQKKSYSNYAHRCWPAADMKCKLQKARQTFQPSAVTWQWIIAHNFARCSAHLLTAFQAPPGRPLSGGAKDQVAASRKQAAALESVYDGQYGFFSTPFWVFLHHLV